MLAQQLANSLALGGAYALMALGFGLIFGVLDLIHWSSGDVMIAGAYLAITCLGASAHSFLVMLAVVVVATTLVGVVVERLNFHALRTKPHMVILIASLGVAMVIQNAILIVWGPARYRFIVDMPIPPLHVFGITLSGSRVLSIILSGVVMVGLDVLLRRSRLGKAIRATILDRDAAILMGINPRFIMVSTFALGSALSGVAMLLLGSMYGVIFPLRGQLHRPDGVRRGDDRRAGQHSRGGAGGGDHRFLPDPERRLHLGDLHGRHHHVPAGPGLIIKPSGILGKPQEENI